MQWVPKAKNDQVQKRIVQLIIFIVDSGCTKHMTGNLKLLCNFVEKFLGTVRFGNDQFAPILGYGDLVQGNVTINRVYYVEGLNHNLFSVGQFCDANLEVAFRKSTCFVRDLQGNDLLTVVDFDADPRVPLILERSIRKTERALIDVLKGELTLRVGKETITFNLDQTLRYSANYNHMMAKQIAVIDIACKEYSQEVLGFFDVIASGNPTPYYDPMVSTSSLTLTLFGDSDFLLEEVDAFLALEDDPTSLEVDQSYFDPEGDFLLLEAFLNDDPSLPPPNQGNYLPQVQKELKICEAKTDKSLID
nr:integrase, catalytic region, zinc finger, CCHC-type, peptidase aspartic, catalytic [Tanacetum cinerariifolium]